MQRRQVVKGLLACALASAFPSSRQMGAYKDFVSSEPVFPEPVNDHENRMVLRPMVSTGAVDGPLDEQQIEQVASSVTQVAHAQRRYGIVQRHSAKDADSNTHESQHDALKSNPFTPSDTLKNAAAQDGSWQSSIDSTDLAQSGHAPIVAKNIDFARHYDDDIFIAAGEEPLLASVSTRLGRLQKIIGYGNFNILNFDEALVFAKRYSKIGAFTSAEKDFIDKVFAFNAQGYGFYGEKVLRSLTTSIKKSSVFKVPGTGHYLFKGQSLAYYEKIRKSVGSGIILTSGVRSNVKQLHLFLAKVIRVNGNLSRASRSLAPPGYSYHGIGDFDVGRKGWGARNFTDDFAQTDEFKRMQDLGYIAIRYDHGNTLGVRFEPWHIQVV